MHSLKGERKEKVNTQTQRRSEEKVREEMRKNIKCDRKIKESVYVE